MEVREARNCRQIGRSDVKEKANDEK